MFDYPNKIKKVSFDFLGFKEVRFKPGTAATSHFMILTILKPQNYR